MLWHWRHARFLCFFFDNLLASHFDNHLAVLAVLMAFLCHLELLPRHAFDCRHLLKQCIFNTRCRSSWTGLCRCNHLNLLTLIFQSVFVLLGLHQSQLIVRQHLLHHFRHLETKTDNQNYRVVKKPIHLTAEICKPSYQFTFLQSLVDRNSYNSFFQGKRNQVRYRGLTKHQNTIR